MKIRKILLFSCVTSIAFGMLSGCGSDDKSKTLEENSDMTANGGYLATEKNVKLLGRTSYDNETLWLASSASGAEFTFVGTKAEITVIGDSVAASSSNEGNYARLGIYVDGERIVDDMLNQAEKSYVVFESEEEKEVTISIVKLSEACNSTIGIKEIKIDSKSGITPTVEKPYSIEFIGDSITCGYGVDDEDKNHHFSTATEDATRAYAYKTAMALNADYSLVSYSGYGIISGYSDDGLKKTSQLVPTFYEKHAFSYGSLNGYSVSNIDWDFNKFQSDVIVVNLGTNDASYCGTDEEKQADYTTSYIEFLKQIRKNNPNAKILCTLGIMGDSLFPCIENAVAEYTSQTQDTNVFAMKFDVQMQNDGYVADWHPTEVTHQKAADKLTLKIKELLEITN